MRRVQVIDLYPPCAKCSVCGKWDLSKWGIPVNSETGEIIANDSTEDWGGIPACEDCWRKHENGAFVGTYPRF